jgi:sugar phosphate isomerase/epimerase
MKASQNRRDFLKVTGASALGIMAVGPLGCTPKSKGVGVQLYSIRDAMDEDVPGSLKKVADLGYKFVELAGYSDGKFYNYAPAEFNKMVTDLGMEVLSSHTQVEAAGITMDNAKIMADAHAELNVKYCVQPWVEEKDRNIEYYKKMVADLNQVGQVMKEVGIQFGYHNHNFEFANLDGIVPYYDIFMPEMDADLITMEIDLYWVTKAGQDPVEMFNKYPGRFQLWHLKDMFTNTAPYFDIQKDDIAPVGEGLIDFQRIMAAQKKAGMKYFFVEDDNQGNGRPFEGIQSSINYINGELLS